MQGENPNLIEYGPIVYDEVMKRNILDIDEEADEIKYTTKAMFTFNRHKSVNVSSSDKVTMLNPAYVGTILMLSSLPPNFMQKYGNISCNEKKFPELNLICKTLKSKRPPVLREGAKEGVYLLSMFQKINNTIHGPYTVNRGVKNITLLGDTTSYMGERVQQIWGSESCNSVRGTDTITWPPLVTPLPFVSTFIGDLCRSLQADYDSDISIHGMTGSKFVMKERVWYLNESQCYCPVVNKKVECLPLGLVDLSKCQEAPVIFSEPHFLHGDVELLTYARGLKPVENLHSTYIVIEPHTGVPLSGAKKSQLNMKLTKQPVDLLSNVSEGYFPLVWCEEGSTPTLKVVGLSYQTMRSVRLAMFLQRLPLIVGIYMVSVSLFLCKNTRSKVEPTRSMIRSTLMSSDQQPYNYSHRPPRWHTNAFERFQRM
ncbi:Sensory neuron membrane protein 2 [Dufourea novaeangliae]|uniref:Sensory neuron membrane protein 2 n=1 Tax=Dufourea novaeangliae TaxID=178035 RepID=A0A154NZF8_DUFNO|nr:Sensory neuron membrane protein 2 [Dufourea novaeangliae]